MGGFRRFVAIGFFAAVSAVAPPVAGAEAFGWRQEQQAPEPPESPVEIRGRVVDRATGEPIAGATVGGIGAVAVTDAEGRFVLEAPFRLSAVSASAEGYFELSVAVPAEGPVEIGLVSQRIEETVEVVAESPEVDRPAAVRVESREVLETAGSVDNIFRALGTLPGVAQTTDFGSFLSVRGGGPDENLTLMDGVEIHNPYRLFGLVSAFHPETVDDFSLSAGGFGAAYGDRLSSLLIVRNRGGRRDFGASSSLSITDGNFVGEGPIAGRGSWLLSARRTYYDVVVGRIFDQNFPSFSDIQFRTDWEWGPGHRLTLTGLRSRENTDFSIEDDDEPDEMVDFQGDTTNDLVSARLDAVISDQATSSTVLAWYRNAELLDFLGLLRTGTRGAGDASEEETEPLDRIAFRRELAVRDFSLRQEFGFEIGSRHFLGMGLELHRIRSGLDQTIDGVRNTTAADPTSIQGGSALPDFLASELVGTRGGAWIQETYRMTDRFSLEPGLRLEWSTVNGRSTLSPRFAAGYDLGAGFRLRAAGGLYTQSPGWEKLLASDNLLDLNAVDRLAFERAVHAVLGVEKSLGAGARFRVEAYWKRYEDLLSGRLETPAETAFRVSRYAFPDELAAAVPSAAQITIDPENGARGSARGLDVYVERNDPSARLVGWISWSLGRAEREVWGARFPFDYDRPQALNVVSVLRISDRWSLAGTGRFASGFPYTPAVGVRVAATEDERGLLVPETDGLGNLIYTVDLGGFDNRNAARLPNYARLDLRLTYQHGGPTGRWSVYAEVINATGRENGTAIEQEVVAGPGGVPTVEEYPEFGFPRIPTIGIRFRF